MGLQPFQAPVENVLMPLDHLQPASQTLGDAAGESSRLQPGTPGNNKKILVLKSGHGNLKVHQIKSQMFGCFPNWNCEKHMVSHGSPRFAGRSTSRISFGLDTNNRCGAKLH